MAPGDGGIDEQVDRFRDFPLFRNLTDEQIGQFVARCEPVDLPAGTVFIEQGTEGEKLFFLDAGEVEVFVRGEDGREHQLAAITAPAVVGEMEFLTREKRSAYVRARTPVRGLSLPFDRFFARLQEGEESCLRVFFHITQVLAKRLAAMDEKFAELEQQAPGNRFHELRDFQQQLMTEWSM